MSDQQQSPAFDQQVKGELNTTLALVMQLLGPDAQKEYEKKLWERTDVGIQYSGHKITLPAEPHPMSLEDARDAIDRKIKEENQKMDVHQIIDGYPFDAMAAFVKAMERTFGWASPVPTPTFFGDKMPQLQNIRTGPFPQDIIQVPMGSFRLPGVSEPVTAELRDWTGNGVVRLGVYGKCRKREKHVIANLMALTEKIMLEESIYKGKALLIPVDAHGNLLQGHEPRFMHTAHVNPAELVLSKEVQEQLEVSLFTPIRHTRRCLELKIPLKRTVLLSGIYGVGKTMIAAVTSKIAVENNVTYITIDNVKGLTAALEFAKRYQPAVIFAEDIDRVTETRDERTNDLMNTIDGILGKDSKVIVVLTTNHIERINRAMMRPGRMDAVIEVTPPDAEAVERLCRLYARNLLSADENISEVGRLLEGQIPATIREVVERAKLGMVHRGARLLVTDDLLVAAKGMKRHIDLLNKDDTPVKSAGDRMADALADIVGNGGSRGASSDLMEKVDAIFDVVDEARSYAETACDRSGKAISMIAEAAEKPNGSMPKSVAVKIDALLEKVENIQKNI